MSNCPLEFVRQDGDRFILRCPVCGSEARSKYADPAMRRQLCGIVRQGRGVGDELFDLLKEIGVSPKAGCDCRKLRLEMNQLGVEGCRERSAGLVKRMQRNAAKYGLAEWAAAGWTALAQGKPLSLAGLLDLAIQRAEARQDGQPTTSPAR